MEGRGQDCIDCLFCKVKSSGKHLGADIECSPLNRVVGQVDIVDVKKGSANFPAPDDCPFNGNS